MNELLKHKCLILILGCNKQPSVRNIDAIFNSYVKLYNDNKSLFNNSFDFIVYSGGYDTCKIEGNKLCLTAGDDIYSTFEKTIEAFTYLNELNEYDYIIRVNISTYVNIFALDYLISNANNDTIYCNAICTYYNSNKYLNNVFPRGDAYIISNKILNQIISTYNQYDVYSDDLSGIEHTDDALLGLIFLKIFKNKTHDHIQLLEYAFIPDIQLSINDYVKSVNVIFSRIKTCPPDAECSGYSWNDNNYRLNDVSKINNLNNFLLKNFEFLKNNAFNNILRDDGDFYIRYNENIIPCKFSLLKRILNERGK